MVASRARMMAIFSCAAALEPNFLQSQMLRGSDDADADAVLAAAGVASDDPDDDATAQEVASSVTTTKRPALALIHHVVGPFNETHTTMTASKKFNCPYNLNNNYSADEDHPEYNLRCAELELLVQDVEAAEAQVQENLDAQSSARDKIASLAEAAKMGSSAVAPKIENYEEQVTKDADSKALAGMLGGMWREMRMYASPQYTVFLNEKLEELAGEEKQLRSNLKTKQDAVEALKAKYAAEDAAQRQSQADGEAAEPQPIKAQKPAKDEDDDDEDKASVASTEAPKAPKSDYNDETEFHEAIPIWPAKSALPVTVEFSIAFIWVLFVASVPFVLARIAGKAQTAIDRTLTALLLVVLFGGLYLFTNVILFQSAHFETHRPLTLVECVYMMSQVITTVGYGDVTPAKQRGQVFVGLYVVVSFLVIAVMMSNLVAHLIKLTASRVDGDDDASIRESPRAANPSRAWMRERPIVSYKELRLQFLVYLFFAATWSLFFAFMPGEGKKWYEAIYMSVITLSTVGFGAFTASTEAGKVFAAFWMIFGSLALVGVIGEFTKVVQSRKQQEDFTPDVNRNFVDEFEQTLGKGRMDEAEFMEFFLLNRQMASREEMEGYRGAFKSLSTPRKRVASAQAISELIENSDTLRNKGRKGGR